MEHISLKDALVRERGDGGRDKWRAVLSICSGLARDFELASIETCRAAVKKAIKERLARAIGDEELPYEAPRGKIILPPSWVEPITEAARETLSANARLGYNRRK